MVVVTPETDFVPRFDAEFVPELLRDHNLPLGPDTMSHT
jgi:hypothetical protein